MIGKIMIGKSFRGCLLYCLSDKELDGQDRIKDRAEVVIYNNCYGNEKVHRNPMLAVVIDCIFSSLLLNEYVV